MIYVLNIIASFIIRGDSRSSFSAEDNAIFGNFEENDPDPHQNVLSASAASVSPHKRVSRNSAVFIYLYFILFFSCIVVLTVRNWKHNFHKFDFRVPAVLTSRETVTGDGQRLFASNDGCMASRRGSSLILQLKPQTKRNHHPQKKIKEQDLQCITS